MRFVMSDFAAGRHKAELPFSHYEGTTDALLAMVASAWPHRLPGYRDGVVRVMLPTEGFRAGTVPLAEGMTLRSTFAPRALGEMAFLQTTVVAPKPEACVVEVILYNVLVLRETGDESGPNAPKLDVGLSGGFRGAGMPPDPPETWEIISINARPGEDEEPLPPVTMMRNFFKLPGGTAAEYTAAEFARSILYWSRHANVGPA